MLLQVECNRQELFVERYISSFLGKYRGAAFEGLPTLPDDLAERAMTEIDVEATDNILILKNMTRSWISEFVERARKDK